MYGIHLGGGQQGGRPARGIQPVVRPVSHSPKNNGPEVKAVNTFVKMFDSLSFDINTFALYFTTTPVVIQRKFLDLIMAYLKMLSARDEHAEYLDEDTYDLVMNAKLAYQSLKPFRS